MSEMKLVEVVKAGARASFRELIESGAEINQQDEQGWTPLNFSMEPIRSK
jgi:ankyrin repeat protein